MELTFNALASVLKKQEEIYRELLSLGKMKQAELVQGTLEAIESLNRQEELLIVQAGRLEEERFNHAAALIKHYSMGEDASLEEIISVAPEVMQGALTSLKNSLTALLKDMQKINSENTLLIQQTLQFIQFTLGAMTQETQTTYTSDRAMKVENLTRILDKKV
ncbi:MAG: flagellar protein FlgN [Clostridia bacterium]|jgi:flagellar biosynthesis/type III secretory pathway chaperone|nr:flagellar protein FlgN [Clostridia bacterium]